MELWQDEGIGFAGFGHCIPGPPIPIHELPVAVKRGIKPSVLRGLGIDSVHHSAPGEHVVQLALRASRDALRDAGIDAALLDLVVMSNSSQRLFTPELCPRLAAELGARSALAFDVCGGCAGFVHALHTAACLMKAKGWRTTLVVSAEQFSRMTPVDSTDSLVSGDAAGAVVLSRGLAADNTILDLVMHSDGSQADVLVAEPPHGAMRYDRGRLLDVAVESQLKVVEELLGRNGVSLDEIDVVFPHAGTNGVLTGLRDSLGLGPEKLATTFAHTGNIVSAMIPTAMSLRQSTGDPRPGRLVLACTTGAGWFSGGMLARI
jgi:3-oxoacyl-[acyl-carrier-protein] synthase-3